MRLKLGIFASSGAAAFFEGIVNWLIGADSGKLWASEDGSNFLQVDTKAFGTSNVNDVFYGVDLSDPTTTPDNINTGTTWTTVTSNFGNTVIYSIAYNSGLWVAGGGSGQMHTSTDGATWTTVNSNFGNAVVLSITYGNGLWVAGGGAGQIRTSTNGSTWTTVTSNFGNASISSIAYGNGLWVAGGSAGQMRISTNGSTWTTVNSNWTLGPFTFAEIRSISYGNDLWVAAGLYYNSSFVPQEQMRTSTNGSTWITVNPNFGTFLTSIAYANGLWVASGGAGQMRTSTDGATWTTVTSNFGNTTIQSIAYSNGLWVAVGQSGQMRTSTDGATWTTVNSNFGNTQINSIAYGNGLWVAVGDIAQMRTSPQLYNTEYNSNTFLAAGDSGKLAKSSDGLTWSTINTGDTTDINVVSYGGESSIPKNSFIQELYDTSPIQANVMAASNNTYVIANESTFARSTNLISWTTHTSGGMNFVKGISYGNGLFVAVSQSGNKVSTSTDGQIWTTQNSNIPPGEFNISGAYAVGYGNGLWVLSGFYFTPSFTSIKVMRSSTNGSTWNTVTSNFGNASTFAITYGNGLWVAGGGAGQMRTSTDGATWTTVTSNFGTTQINSVAYGNGLWVAGGGAGQIRTSTNGSTWTTVTSNFGISGFSHIAYGNGQWFAQNEYLHTSTNGTSWEPLFPNSLPILGHFNNKMLFSLATNKIGVLNDEVNKNFKSYFIGVE